MKIAVLVILGGLSLYAGDLKDFSQQQQQQAPIEEPENRFPKFKKKLAELEGAIDSLSCDNLGKLEGALIEKQDSSRTRAKKMFYSKAEGIVAEAYFYKGCGELEE